jgi:tetratricopeptide (TPR) repeat protein/DNA-binding MarR family transcriptional regulator
VGGQSYLPIEILDYVETHVPPEDSPYGISQRELAKALGYHPCSVSRPLGVLVREGLLNARRGLVRDGLRRQIVYRITDRGRGRLSRETKHVPLLAGALPPPPNPFLGRREELDRLAEFVRSGGTVMLIDGPPGMGKTALVSRHIRRVKRGRVPFWFTVRPAASPRQFVTSLSHALSFLGAPQLAYYSQLPRAPVAREVTDLAARALDNRELAVVIDDVQMADGNLRKFLSEFIAGLTRNRQHQFYVVGQETLSLEGPPESISRMTVGGLDRSAAHDLTDRRGGLADRFESVFQSTFGSPLLLQLAVSNPEVEADAATLPNRVVERLTREEIRALVPLALSNEPLPLEFVSDVGTISADRLTEVVRMGIIQKTLQGRLEILQVVRAALLNRVGPGEEKEAHLKLAEFYAGSHRPEAVRERFLHQVDGEDWRDASQLVVQQEKALFELGYSDALRAALRHLSLALPRGTAKVKVQFAEAALLRHHSDYSDAVSILQRAISDPKEDGKIVCDAQLQIVELLIRLRRIDEAAQAFEQAKTIGPATRRLQVFFLLSRSRLAEARGESRDARIGYREAFELARRYRVRDLALESIAAWSRMEELEGETESALRIIEAALPEARMAGRSDIAFNLRLARARSYFRLGQIDQAETEMRQVRLEAESLGYLNQLTYSLHGLAATAFQGSRWVEGLAYAKQACNLSERLGNDLVLGHTLALICTAEVRQARAGGGPELVRDAIAHGERSVEVLSRGPPSEALAFAHSYLAEAYLDANEVDSCVVHHQTSLELCDRLNIGWLRGLIEAETGARLRASMPTTG